MKEAVFGALERGVGDSSIDVNVFLIWEIGITKVYEFKFGQRVGGGLNDHKVGWLDISMDNTEGVEIFDYKDYLLADVDYL